PSRPAETMTDPDTVTEPVGLVLQPYTARHGPDEWSIAPELLLPKATRVVEQEGLRFGGAEHIDLSPDEKGRYGEWQRLGLADHHLSGAVSSMAERGTFVVGLLGNCNSSLGMLAGLQKSDPSGRPLRVGLIWIDAHADFNTPETSLSGWLGGMPVSVASGQSLVRLRMTAGLDVPISTRNIVMMGQRDVDPLEQVLLDNSQATQVSAEALLSQSQEMKTAVDQLSRRVDVIYLHVDLDILDATEIPGSFFETPGGPTADQVAGPLRTLMRNPKVRALGVSSFPTAEKGREKSMASAMTLLRAAMDGLKDRGSS
ncbi:MAG: arginase family protein, partial [Gemmatimonadetes bacterium]|nr:arginase family protein [Gemmatimonadota bacterium]